MRGAGLVSGLFILGVRCATVRATVSAAWPSEVRGKAGEHGLSPGGKPSVGVATQQKPREANSAAGATTATTTDVATDDTLSFSCANEYPKVLGAAWPHTAEPFRETVFTAHSNVGDLDNDVFIWTFPDATVLEGREVTFFFESVGRQVVSLAQTVVATGKTHHLESSVMVKYVRREIRQLKEKDRLAFFDAMETLYRLPTAEGNRLYGDEYKGINFFVQMHLDGAGVTDCDHWHDDAGIMTHHVGYTLLFEQALQLVDPTVSIPYWEYTIEAAQGLSDYGDSDIFADDWFGNASPENALHTVDKGRWAYLPVMSEAWEYVHNSYGLLRSPWNVDSTPYVTRHNMTNNEDSTEVVTCEKYEACFTSNTMKGMNNCLNGGTHGPVHIKVGGEWNDPEEDFTQTVGYSSSVPLMTKYLWRMGYLRTPKSCTVEENGTGDLSNCRASCPAELYESRGMSPYDVLMDALALHWIAQFSQGTVVYDKDEDEFQVAGHEDDEEFTAVFWKKMLNSLCDAGHVGELFTSSAPYDPLFWVIHPTAERFLSWRRKLGREKSDDGWSFDETWGYTHGHVIGETGMVCDWSGVRDGTLDLPTCNKGICGGHNEDDILPFEIKVKGKIVKMSNAEWLDFIYPDNDDLPYMYNEFSWDHCADEGYSMGVIEA